MSLSQIVDRVKNEVAERADHARGQISTEVESALVIGAALPEEVVGALRLRSHRFVRGGWKFHRCMNPACGKVYPRGEEHCSDCHHPTAPLYLCRNCGADYLRVVGELDEGRDTLRPSAIEEDGPEWMICQPEQFDLLTSTRTMTRRFKRKFHAGRRANQAPQEIRGTAGLDGSLDPGDPQVQQRPSLLQCPGDPPPRAKPLRLLRQDWPAATMSSAPSAWVPPPPSRCWAKGSPRSSPRPTANARTTTAKSDCSSSAIAGKTPRHQARFIVFASRYDRLRRRRHRDSRDRAERVRLYSARRATRCRRDRGTG